MGQDPLTSTIDTGSLATVNPVKPQPARTNYGFNTYDPNRVTPEYSSEQQGNAASTATELANQGYTVGRSYQEPFQTQASHDVTEESRAQRFIEKQKHYAYGGTPYGADEAVAAGRATAAQYTAPMTSLAQGALATGGELQAREGPITDYSAANQSRANEMDTYNALMQAGTEQGPSAAQAQLQMGTNAALAGQLALARSGRGAGESASSLRQAAFGAADIQSNAANQSAILRAQEDEAFRQRQIAAFGTAGGIAGQVRGADIGATQFLSDEELKNRQLNDAAGLQYSQLALSGYGQGAQTALSAEQLANQIRSEQLTGSMGYEADVSHVPNAAGSKGPNWGGYIGAGAGAVGGFFAGGPAGSAAGAGVGYKIGTDIQNS